jgi:hypothetical protein
VGVRLSSCARGAHARVERRAHREQRVGRHERARLARDLLEPRSPVLDDRKRARRPIGLARQTRARERRRELDGGLRAEPIEEISGETTIEVTLCSAATATFRSRPGGPVHADYGLRHAASSRPPLPRCFQPPGKNGGTFHAMPCRLSSQEPSTPLPCRRPPLPRCFQPPARMVEPSMPRMVVSSRRQEWWNLPCQEWWNLPCHAAMPWNLPCHAAAGTFHAAAGIRPNLSCCCWGWELWHPARRARRAPGRQPQQRPRQPHWHHEGATSPAAQGGGALIIDGTHGPMVPVELVTSCPLSHPVSRGASSRANLGNEGQDGDPSPLGSSTQREDGAIAKYFGALAKYHWARWRLER